MPKSTTHEIEIPGSGWVSIFRSVPEGSPRLRFVYAPGAGSNLDDPFGVYCAERLTAAGIECWRFQFPYMEAKRRAPDRGPVLEATWSSIIAAASEAGLPLVIGGRSMGGRIGSQVVAQGASVAALILFAYPLHPPGKPEQRRDQHLSAIGAPTLLCSGTRDPFASPRELEETQKQIPSATLKLMQDADHGFSAPKSSGRNRDDVWAEAIDATLHFLAERGIG